MSSINILIVEDEAIVAADLKNKLGRIGYGVSGIAPDGAQAVEMALNQKPQLILMDIQLDGPLDGIETAMEIQRRQDVPIVYLTAHSDRATLSRAKLSGPFGYILKPFDDSQLALQIELAIYKHQTEKQLQDQRELLHVTLHSIGEGVIATDGDGDIAFINPVAESLTGWSNDTAIGKPIDRVFRIVDEHTRAPLTDLIVNLQSEAKLSSPASHWQLVAREGRKLPVWISGAPIRDSRQRFRGVVLVFRDISRQRQSESEKDALLAELQNAMGKVRMLSGLLPICSSCKKIRDDNGDWNQIEDYIGKRSEADFSHGICPDCVKKLYPGFNLNAGDGGD